MIRQHPGFQTYNTGLISELTIHMAKKCLGHFA